MIRPTLPRDFKLHIPEEIVRRLSRCRTSMRQAIQAQLEKIAVAEAAKRSPRRAAPPLDPPLRFYASETFRVSYRIDRLRRKVVVLELCSAVGG